MTDQRVAARPGDVGVKGGTPPEGGTAKAGKGRKKIVMILMVLVALGGAAFFFLKPSGEAEAAAEPPPPEPGGVVEVEPLSMNLANGHYLRIGFTMQLTAEAGEELQSAEALDLAIALFSGRAMEEVNDATHRAELKAEFLTQLQEAYEGEVMEVYFTDFVTQ